MSEQRSVILADYFCSFECSLDSRGTRSRGGHRVQHSFDTAGAARALRDD